MKIENPKIFWVDFLICAVIAVYVAKDSWSCAYGWAVFYLLRSVDQLVYMKFVAMKNSGLL